MAAPFGGCRPNAGSAELRGVRPRVDSLPLLPYLLCSYGGCMRTQVQRWGNSLAVRIPKAFAVDLGLDRDAHVDLQVREGALVIRPSAEYRFELSILLSQVNPENLHGELQWQGPTGREEW